MISRKVKFLNIRRQALREQSYQLKIATSELDLQEKQVAEYLDQCSKKKDEISRKNLQREKLLGKLKAKNEGYLERVNFKMGKKRELRKLRGMRKDNMLDMIIANSQEKREIIDQHEKLVENTNRLSVLFKTHLEQITMSEKTFIKNLCGKYHLDDRIDFDKVLKAYKEKLVYKRKENMIRYRRINKLKDKMELLKKSINSKNN
jgi:hypothetical protein